MVKLKRSIKYQRFNSSGSSEMNRSLSEENVCSACAGSGPPRFHSVNCKKSNRLPLEAGGGSFQEKNDPTSSKIKRKPPTWLFGTVLNPRSSSIRRYNRWLLISCVVGVAVDPLFLSVLAIHPQLACLYVQKGYALAVLLLRGLVDTMYLWHMWLQLKLAYVSKKSLFLGRGELVWDPRQIAWHYLRPLRRFWFDVFVILPVPQVMVLFVVPYLLNEGGSTMRIMHFELLAFLFQYIPKLLHFVLLGWRLQRVTGYIFGTAFWGFVLNLAAYFCAAHVAGSIWYLLTVQRVESCIHLQCQNMPGCNYSYMGCPVPIAFSKQPLDDLRVAWAQNPNVTGCLHGGDDFGFGIYSLSVPLVTDVIPVNKILLPLFWGVMTMSSFGNALTPTDHTLEVAFSILVVTCGLLLFTMLIGNIQVFLHSMTAKKEESQLRIRDLEWWMRRRQLPARLRQRVCKYERQKWAATRGIDEEATVQDLPEGLRRDIKRHLCLDLVRQVPLFQQMDDLVLNNICERLKPGLFIKDETVLSEGDPVWRMLFIVRGHMESSYRLRHNNTNSICMLGPGNFCGDELISWCLSTPLKDNLPLSKVTLKTVDMTEVFGLDAQDLKYITEHFRYKFANEKLKRTVRFYSSSWRTWAAVTLQLAWRRHKARRTPNTSGPLNFAEVSLAPNNALRGSTLSQSQRDRLRLYTAMFTSPKPQDNLE
ncbi:hypothetical protein CY35_09G101200 [Sphagnum magellanicum]|nr:hypothetical protein CY35_09G101200 [Sphagnum magellanicum]KAH9553092.1 hypothetical protein CY35_09G101200 [Sphagnum magellanicum]